MLTEWHNAFYFLVGLFNKMTGLFNKMCYFIN